MTYTLRLLEPNDPACKDRKGREAYAQAIYRNGEPLPVFRFAANEPWATRMLKTLNEGIT